MRRYLIILLLLLVPRIADAVTCTAVQIAAYEDTMTSTLNANSLTNVTLMLEAGDARTYTHNKGTMTAVQGLASASSSKIPAAVAILDLVDRGYLTLNSKPSDFLTWWTPPAGHVFNDITLRHLLAFTSGFNYEPACITSLYSYEGCMQATYNTALNDSGTTAAGAAFVYSSSHLQLAGLMAMKARGYTTWSSVWTEFRNLHSVFPNGPFNYPSTTHPRLAGGMWSTRADEYMVFLRKLKADEILPNSMRVNMFTTQRGSAPRPALLASPSRSSLGEDWAYGLGIWSECRASTYNCGLTFTRNSGPGAYGMYPFVDTQYDYIGTVHRQGSLNSWDLSVDYLRAIEGTAASWSACRLSSSAPTAPQGVNAVAGDAQVTVNWSAQTTATSYNIYWNTVPGVTKTTGIKITGVNIPYVHTGRTNGQTYYYIVTAVNTGGESGASSEVFATPAAATSTTYFRESFDNTSYASRGWYDGTSLGVIDTANKIEGVGSLACDFLVGGTTCKEGNFKLRHAIPATDKVYISYWVKHNAAWQGSGTTNLVFPHFIHLLTNMNTSLADPYYTYLSVYIEENMGFPQIMLQDGQNVDQARINQNLIGISENRAVAGCNGLQSGIGITAQNGLQDCYVSGAVYWNDMGWIGPTATFFNATAKLNWNFVEAYVQLNSVAGGIGQADGVIRAWLNGALIFERTNVIIRTGARSTMQFNQFVLYPYIGSTAPVAESIWIDDLTVANDRAASSTYIPSAPTNVRCGI